MPLPDRSRIIPTIVHPDLVSRSAGTISDWAASPRKKQNHSRTDHRMGCVLATNLAKRSAKQPFMT